MRKTRRTAQVGETVRDALVEIFRRDLKDLSMGLTSITGVDISPDLHFARVFLSGMTEAETKATVKELQARKPRIRALLGQRIHLRYTPDLEFVYDETTMRASRIESILQQVIPKEPTNDDDSERAADDDRDDES